MAAIFIELMNGIKRILRRHVQQIAAIIHGSAVGLAIELENGAAQRGLAAAGFADQTEYLAFINIQRDSVVRLNGQTALEREVLL